MRRLWQALQRFYLRGRIYEYTLALEQEQQRIEQWPERQQMWLRERAMLSNRLHRLRGVTDMVNHQFRPRT